MKMVSWIPPSCEKIMVKMVSCIPSSGEKMMVKMDSWMPPSGEMGAWIPPSWCNWPCSQYAYPLLGAHRVPPTGVTDGGNMAALC